MGIAKVDFFLFLQRLNQLNKAMKYSELEKKLRRAGCYPVTGGDHPIWYSPITGKKFKTGHHKSHEVKEGTLRALLKTSGIV